MGMRRIYITIFLFFTISFSSEYQEQIQDSLMENEIVPIIFQPIITPSFKLYDFLIYPSHDTFQYTILPFLSSSENLLKIFFYFQKLHPTVNLAKFLPYSTIKKDVLDLQDSPFVYIFQDEYKLFNPILYSHNNYKTCTINDKNIKEDSICALFPTNKILFLKTYILSDERSVYAAFNQEDRMFFVAIKTGDSEQLTAIAHGIIESQRYWRPDIWGICSFNNTNTGLLDCILDAHNLTGFSKLSLKFYYFYDTTYFGFFVTLNLDKVSNEYLKRTLFTIFCIFCPILYYHVVMMLPFHIVSIPFQILIQNDCILCLIISRYDYLPKSFINFWIFPFCFYSIFRLCFARLNELNIEFKTRDIRPPETMWAVKYLLLRKQLDLCEGCFTTLLFLMVVFGVGFGFSYPFLPFFIINGESYDK